MNKLDSPYLQPPGWAEPPTTEPDFYDWREAISEADKKAWCLEFVTKRTGPLSLIFDWHDAMCGSHWAYIDIDKVYIRDEWLARDSGGYITTERGGKTLYRVDMDDILSFIVAEHYSRIYAGEVKFAVNALHRLQVDIVHDLLMRALDDEENMRTIWESSDE